MKYCLRVICILLLYLFFSQFVPKAFADCDTIAAFKSPNAPVNAQTGQPIVFEGTTNCQASSGDQVQLVVQDAKANYEDGVLIKIDNNGNFKTSYTFKQAGNFEVVVRVGPTFLHAKPPFTLTVSGEQRRSQCGAEVSITDKNSCPDTCPAVEITTQGQGAKFICQTPQTIDRSALEARCNTSTIDINTLTPCDDTAPVQTALACGPNKQGHVCTDTTAILCKKGSEILCSPVVATPEVNPTALPSPTPFNPPCLRYVDAQGNTTTDPKAISKCVEVNGFSGAFATDPAAFITWLFGLLLSISGAILIVIFISQGYRLMTSQGKPETIQSAREAITSAIVGLLFMIFALVILEIIGVDILHLTDIFTH